MRGLFLRGLGCVTYVSERQPHPSQETLTPLVLLSLRAFKGEGEIRTETHLRHRRRWVSSSVLKGRMVSARRPE